MPDENILSADTPIDPSDQFPWKYLTITFIGIVILWVLSIVLLRWWFGSWEDANRFGGSFGAIAALFTGLALAGVVVAIFLQKSELELQRQELQLTRKELQRAAKAQESSERALVEQANSLALTAKLTRQNFSPVFLLEMARSMEFPILVMKNLGKLPAVDLSILVVATYFDIDTTEADLRKICPGDFELRPEEVDGLGRAFTISGDYSASILPSEMQLVAELNFPVLPGALSVFVQFFDSQLDNFSQHYSFIKNDWEYELVSVNPPTPVEAVRIRCKYGFPKLEEFPYKLVSTDELPIPSHGKVFVERWNRSVFDLELGIKVARNRNKCTLSRISEVGVKLLS